MIPLLSKFKSDDLSEHVKNVAYVDHLTGGGCLRHLKKWFDNVVEYRPAAFGYNAEQKSWLIVNKESMSNVAVEIF